MSGIQSQQMRNIDICNKDLCTHLLESLLDAHGTLGRGSLGLSGDLLLRDLLGNLFDVRHFVEI